MKKDNKLKGKGCKLSMNGNFVLDGVVIDLNDSGVWFETRQKTSFISWKKIDALIPE